jgi:hypothetical protein
MQISAIAPATATVPGATLGTATLIDGERSTPGHRVTFQADVHAGRVLRTGVKDIAKVGWELVMATHDRDPKAGGPSSTWGTVGFVRNGDAWDAVELLVPERPGGPEHVMWTIHEAQAIKLAPGVQIDGVWQVSHYGGDYTASAKKLFAKG